jgi:hypothetical protein
MTSPLLNTKPDHMKQNNPYEQMLVTLIQLEGGLENLKDGIPTNIDNLLKSIEDLRHLSAYLPMKEW